MLMMMVMVQAGDTGDGDGEDDDALHAVDECSMMMMMLATVINEEVDKDTTGMRAAGTVIYHGDGEDVHEDDEEDHQEMTNYADDIWWQPVM